MIIVMIMIVIRVLLRYCFRCFLFWCHFFSVRCFVLIWYIFRDSCYLFVLSLFFVCSWHHSEGCVSAAPHAREFKKKRLLSLDVSWLHADIAPIFPRTFESSRTSFWQVDSTPTRVFYPDPDMTFCPDTRIHFKLALWFLPRPVLAAARIHDLPG